MKLKLVTKQKFASLAAVGAGALFVSAEDAQASVMIYTPTPGSNSVGFLPGDQTIFTYAPGGGTAKLLFGAGTYSSSSSFTNFVGAAGIGALDFHNGIVGAGAVFLNPAGSFSVGALHRWYTTSSGYTYTDSHLHGNGSFTTQYALFRFLLGGQTFYGWAELDFDNPLPGLNGPSLRINRIAWDDQPDFLLAAGDEVGSAPTSVPEPSSVVMSGLGALALGAAGVRRWRKAKQQQAA